MARADGELMYAVRLSALSNENNMPMSLKKRNEQNSAGSTPAIGAKTNFKKIKGEKGTVTRPKFCRGLVDPKKNVVSTEKIGHFVTLCMLLSAKRQKIYTIFQRKEMYLWLTKTKKRLPILPK